MFVLWLDKYDYNIKNNGITVIILYKPTYIPMLEDNPPIQPPQQPHP